MGREDWYRNKTWGEKTKKAFFERLNRSRGSVHKAQYVSIQASYLCETGKKKYVRAALELLDLILEKWPEPFELAAAHLERAKCFENLGDCRATIESYRASVKAEREHPGVRVNAGLEFAWFVVRQGLPEYYDEIISAMEADKDHLPIFPNNQFKFFSVISIILDHGGEAEDARRFAKRALEAVAKKESPFRYHKKVGLVTNPEKAILKKLRRIAERKCQ
ncbi:MAG: hypothetical protein ACYS8Z_20200 [Planctomycetota bacterium]|jgi:tetratricopeptide (TPR) repeat protein